MSNKYDFYDLAKVEELAGRPETVEIDGYYWDPTDLPPKDYLDTQVPLQFKNIGKWMRSKMNGLQTRETMARLAEMVGINTHRAVDVAERTQIRQDAVETDFEALQRSNTEEAFWGAEIVVASDGEATLKKRLDRDYSQVIETKLNVDNIRNPLLYGVLNDGSNTQEALNNLPAGYDYFFPAGVYGVKGFEDGNLFVGHGFRPKSNTTYTFHPQAVIKVLPNSHRIYHAITLDGQKNVVLNNPNIEGERDEHIIPSGGDTHEWGHGIHISSDTQVKIYNPTISNTHGDGIDIYAFEGSDIEIYYPKIKRARRNGISVESVDRLRIYHPEIDDTHGIAPEAGIDFEPFNASSPATAIMKDVVVHEPIIKNSASTGLAFTFLANTVDKFFDITINGGVFDGVKTYDIAPLNTGKVVFNLPRIHGGGHGIHEINSYTNFTYNEPSIFIDKSRNPGTKSAYYVIRMKDYANWTGFTTINNMRFLNEASDELDVIGLDLEELGQSNSVITNLVISVIENKSVGRGLRNYKNLNLNESTISRIPNANKSYTENAMFSEINIGNTLNNLGADKALTFQLNNPGNLNSVNSEITIEVMNNHNIHLFGDTIKFLPYNKNTLILSGVGTRCVVKPIKIGGVSYLLVTESNNTITTGGS